MKKTTATTAVLLVSASFTVVGAGAAQANDRGVVRQGSCTGSTHAKIKAKPDDGRIEVESEIDSNRSGQVWRWTLRHDGRVVSHGRSRTAGRSGSFEVERRPRDTAGADAFKFRAVNAATGEVCVARVRL
ncbi:hypothetical protein [Nocardioides sp. URHA0020]|uniref:hypothetical protein n=1 Tax=Nocardioides sp. URHA0020 TaxID=1380392 RepID=UPI00048CF0C6|nr:hypothetical protein [Nocardioides sp. URHA0020]